MKSSAVVSLRPVRSSPARSFWRGPDSLRGHAGWPSPGCGTVIPKPTRGRFVACCIGRSRPCGGWKRDDDSRRDARRPRKRARVTGDSLHGVGIARHQCLSTACQGRPTTGTLSSSCPTWRKPGKMLMNCRCAAGRIARQRHQVKSPDQSRSRKICHGRISIPSTRRGDRSMDTTMACRSDTSSFSAFSPRRS